MPVPHKWHEWGLSPFQNTIYGVYPNFLPPAKWGLSPFRALTRMGSVPFPGCFANGVCPLFQASKMGSVPIPGPPAQKGSVPIFCGVCPLSAGLPKRGLSPFSKASQMGSVPFLSAPKNGVCPYSLPPGKWGLSPCGGGGRFSNRWKKVGDFFQPLEKSGGPPPGHSAPSLPPLLRVSASPREIGCQ